MDLPTRDALNRLAQKVLELEERLSTLAAIHGAAWDEGGKLVRCFPIMLPPYEQVKAGEFVGEPMEVPL